MPGTASPARPAPRRALRQAQTREEIVRAAWQLVRANGLAGLSMRDLGEAVGMRAQSVYSYFPSKDAIYDAMFREGYLAFLDEIERDRSSMPVDPVARMREVARRFMRFCTEDPARFQLLFHRTIPGFEPTPESYAVAVTALQALSDEFAAVGITDPEATDLASAITTGLASQQIANDPGGDRWERLVDRAVVMFLNEVAPHLTHPQPLAPTTADQGGMA